MTIDDASPGTALAAYVSVAAAFLGGGYALWSGTALHPQLSAGLIAVSLGLLALGTRVNAARLPGWVALAAYWALQPMHLYFRDVADVFNASFAAAAVPFFLYLGYREAMGDDRPLRFAAGMAAVAGGGYFAIYYFPVLGDALRYLVASLSHGIVEAATGNSVSLMAHGSPGSPDYLPILEYGNARVGIILACTGIQSILIFAGAILVTAAPLARKGMALLATVPTIFGLNLLRVSGEVWGIDRLVAMGWTEMAAYNLLENGVAKVASLVALVVLAYVTFHILPSLQDDILDLLRMPRRKGPLERAVLRE